MILSKNCISVVAAAIVAIGALLNNKSVEITVKNYGCPAISAINQKGIDIPGLKLPANSIRSGGEDIIKMPGVNVDVKFDNSGTAFLSVLGFKKDFRLPSNYKDMLKKIWEGYIFKCTLSM